MRRFRLAQNASQLCKYAQRDIFNLRRQQFRKIIADKYKHLCNDTTPLTGNLLGDITLKNKSRRSTRCGKLGKIYRNTNPKMNRQRETKLRSSTVHRKDNNNNNNNNNNNKQNKFKNRFSYQYQNLFHMVKLSEG